MQCTPLVQRPLRGDTPLLGGSCTPVVVGFRAAASETPESPPWRSGLDPGSQQRRHSLLSDLLRDVSAAAAQADAILRGGGAAAALRDDDDDDDYDEGELDEDELSLLAALDGGWGSPAGSLVSAASGLTAATAASAASSSRPIAIPAATYFKDEAQRAHLEKLNKKRQWYSQQQEQERLLGKTGAKAAAQQVPRPPLKQHKQFNGHGGHQK
ncbi:hypothetical protein Rsub_05981 [Raphidocelis subcapitata]|uniref:Uncharacterized protein n=1 Tax=Raphidocelis subcapitata TaxID=307507 RepID=A0A2V0P0Z7_9CHLO|nr:hypothetical protein Rsub_05981 [Raphidocelis subcapitata]|eukprot:GBF93249.1 hypothetical protein Rsub_05981 [Raphidocelis subcapitata]